MHTRMHVYTQNGHACSLVLVAKMEEVEKALFT